LASYWKTAVIAGGALAAIYLIQKGYNSYIEWTEMKELQEIRHVQNFPEELLSPNEQYLIQKLKYERL
jgi:hypothetical protein